MCNLASPVRIITDHRNLTAFTTKRILNRRQARWALELAELDFYLEFRPGIKNSRADALTRRVEDLHTIKNKNPDDLIISPVKIIKPNGFIINNSQTTNYLLDTKIESSKILLEKFLVKEFKQALESDTFG